MTINDNLNQIEKTLPTGVKLIAVSKMKPIEDLRSAYEAGQRRFGENKVQELREKHPLLPEDMEWHMIGHLQTNKVKYIAPFVYMIHAVDSFKLLREINKRAKAHHRAIKVLLQVRIAKEDTKFGLDKASLFELVNHPEISDLKNVTLSGLMGMATNTSDQELIRSEFKQLKNYFDVLKTSHLKNDSFCELSMGMSNDYKIAIEEGSTMIRLGTSIFGLRACAI